MDEDDFERKGDVHGNQNKKHMAYPAPVIVFYLVCSNILEKSKWIRMHIDTAGKRPAVMYTIRIERMKTQVSFCSEEIIRGPLFENEETNEDGVHMQTESMTHGYQSSVNKIAQFRSGVSP